MSEEKEGTLQEYLEMSDEDFIKEVDRFEKELEETEE